jgi:protein SCO1/2
MMRSRYDFLLLGLILVGLLTLLGVLVWRGQGYQFEGSLIATPLPAQDFTLIDQNRQPFQLSAQRGRLVVMFFGYTHCPDVCPTTLAEMRSLRADLGASRDEVEFVFITVDPERDTPEILGEHVALFDAAIHALTGDPADLAQVYQAFGVVATKQESASGALGYLVDHTARLFIIDRQGNFRLTYPFGFDRARILKDLRYLLKEGN